jgi:hypothetical protein
VASAVRLIAKAELTGTIGRILPMVDNGEETMIGNLTTEDGIGWRSLCKAYAGGRRVLRYALQGDRAS